MSTPHNNLPAPVSSFIGRAQELTEIARLLGERRLVTLIGPGGTGKTRLALRAAEQARDQFPDGVWLIELAPLKSPVLVAETIVKALRAPEMSDSAPLDRLGAFIGPRRMLLTLDNCEHLIEECARVAGALLAACPALVILATSREPLMIAGERALRVAPLSLPPADVTRDIDVARLLEHDGIRLFVERASAAEPSFRFSSVTAPAVVEICQRLDGIPLALELAAMRVRGLGVAHLAGRLDDRFRLLTGGDRGREPRQRTLLAAVDWSYDLLTERERVLMRRLGIFVGAFTLEAVEAVCLDTEAYNGADLPASAILDGLTRLVDKSLVQFDQDAGSYRLLETIRQYCLERLEAAGELKFTQRQRFAYYLQSVERGAARMGGPEQQEWMAWLEQEHDNLRAALAWAIQAPRADEAARLALGLTPFWRKRVYHNEGLRWLQQVLALDASNPLPDALRPRLYIALGSLAHMAGRFDEGTAYFEEALRLYATAEDEAGIARAQIGLGRLLFDQARPEEALEHAQIGLAIAERFGDRRLLADALMFHATVSIESGRHEGHVPVLERAIALWREVGDQDGLAACLATLGNAYQRAGDYERSRPYLAEATYLIVRRGSYADLIGALVGLHFQTASTLQTPEQALDAARVIGCMQAWERAMYIAPSPWWQSDVEKNLRERLIAMIGEERLEQGCAEGRSLTTEKFLALVDRITTPAKPDTSPAMPASPGATDTGLTPRETEVLRLVARGLTNAQVARELVVTPRTVNAHLTAIYAKLGVTARGGAIRYAMEHQLG
ncbi:MAG TPA: LuxR C-terminal-related transcriptional regulator [Ktedonobacterales bacterium]